METRSPVNQRGFTLIELMIVVVVIGILAALAIPRFLQATTKSKQLEAKQILLEIYKAQQTYKQTNGTYWISGGLIANVAAPNAFFPLDVEIPSTARYSYSFTLETATMFTVQATVAAPGLDDDAAPDTWTINDQGQLVCESDDSVL